MPDNHPWEQFVRLAALADDQIPLDLAALLIAASENPGLDLAHYQSALDSLASGVASRLGRERDPLFSMNTLSQYLFDEQGFRGNQEDYYDPRNSFLDQVLDRRLGIPITLSVVYMEVGRRAGIPLVGVGMPGHFLVRHQHVEELFLDAFYGGILLSEEECAQRLRQVTRASIPWHPRYLEPVGTRQVLARMLRNLKAIYLQQDDALRALRTVEWLLALQPHLPQGHRDRGLLHYQLGHYTQALEDLKDYLALAPSNADTEAIRELVERLQQVLDG